MDVFVVFYEDYDGGHPIAVYRAEADALSRKSSEIESIKPNTIDGQRDAWINVVKMRLE